MNKKIDRLRASIKRKEKQAAELQVVIDEERNQLKLLEDEEIVKRIRTMADTPEGIYELINRLEEKGTDNGYFN